MTWIYMGPYQQDPPGIPQFEWGLVPEEQRRPTIDWTSRQRKRISQYVFRNTCAQPEADLTESRHARR
jgi:hypothetical protein